MILKIHTEPKPKPKRYPELMVNDDLSITFVTESGGIVAKATACDGSGNRRRNCRRALEDLDYATDFAEWGPDGECLKIK